MKKSIIIGILITLLAVSNVFAEVNVFINGNYLEFKDAKPTTIEGRTMVPISVISKNLGIEYTFDADTQTVIFNNEGQKLSLKIGDQNSYLQGGRTYVPLKFIAENFGMDVDWRENSKTVVIGENAKSVVVEPIEDEVKLYNQLSAFKSTPINEVAFLKDVDFRLDNRDEWGKAEDIQNIYFLTKKDLPVRLGNVVITDIVTDNYLQAEHIMVSGYVIEGEMGLGTITTGLIDTQGRYRHRNFSSFSQEYQNIYGNKYPNLKGLYDNGINHITSFAGEKFTYFLLVNPNGSELDYGSFNIKNIDKIIMYSYKQGKNVIVFDDLLK